MSISHVRRWEKNPILWTLISCVALRESIHRHRQSLVFVDFCLFSTSFYPMPFNSFICLSFSIVLEHKKKQKTYVWPWPYSCLMCRWFFFCRLSLFLLRFLSSKCMFNFLSTEHREFLIANKVFWNIHGGIVKKRSTKKKTHTKKVFIFIYLHHHIGLKIVYIVFW